MNIYTLEIYRYTVDRSTCSLALFQYYCSYYKEHLPVYLLNMLFRSTQDSSAGLGGKKSYRVKIIIHYLVIHCVIFAYVYLTTFTHSL